MKTVSVAVVGSGMSGCSVAAELARQGIPSVVVEAGPDAGRTHVAADPDSAGLAEPAADRHFVPYLADAPGPHYDRWCGLRRRVGGRSLYWRGISLRIEPYALACWPAVVRRRLEGPDGGGLYDEVTAELERWTGRPLDTPCGDREAALLDTVRARGYADATVTPRAFRTPPGTRAGGGAWEAYSPLAELPPGTVRTGLNVAGLAPGPDGTVELRPGTHSGEVIRARAVVLCAGTVENARLAASLARVGGLATPRAYPVVDHLVRGWVAATTESGPADASVLAVRDDAARSNVVIEASAPGGAGLLDAWAMGEQLPTGASHLSFDEESRITIASTLSDADQEVLGRQASLLHGLADAMGVAHEPARPVDLDLDYNTATELARAAPGRAFAYHCRPGSLDHESGALALGGPSVDDTGRLRDLGPVYVAGPSLFPRTGAANPSLTTLALSRYIAQSVLDAV